MRTLLLGLLVMGLGILLTCSKAEPRPPVAGVVRHELVAHGDVRVDEYYWLREGDNPTVIDDLEAENAYTDAVMEDSRPLQKVLFDEFKGRIRQTDSSVPVRDHGFLYYNRTEDGEEYKIHCRVADEPGAEEQILLDVNALAEGHDFCSAGWIQVSRESDIMVYAVDTVGRRKYTLRFRDLGAGTDPADEIPDVTGDAAWMNDGRTVIYTKQDPTTLRSFQVWRHVVGTDPAEDALLYQENDETFNVELFKTTSDRFIVVESNQTTTTEVRVIDADDPAAEPVVVAPRDRGVEYHVDHQGDRFLIRTNLDAENFRLMETPVSSPGRGSWREIVPHREDVLLQGVRVFRDHVVLSERASALSRLDVIDTRNGSSRMIAFDETAYDVWVDDNREIDTNVLRFGYTSADRLVASGRSAGGLLMGAVANMEPGLFAAIVTEVPFVDVVTTMLDDSIPLTAAERDEWGDPREEVYYEYMLSYSPYDRVEAKDYPAMMVTAGLHDSQVQYWEPTKWVARLRALKTDDRLLVLRTHMDTGHGGASGRFGAYRERAEEYAFMIRTVSSGG